jgi:DNA-binding response OmpR family regulator
LATHILLIEDDQLLRMLTASALQERGYSVTEAASGEDAKHRFDEGDYHAILLDLGLPDLPGVKVAEYIRRDARGQAIPILALSGENTAQTRIECTEASIDDFIAKPFDLEQLDRRLIALTRRVDSQSPTTLDG